MTDCMKVTCRTDSIIQSEFNGSKEDNQSLCTVLLSASSSSSSLSSSSELESPTYKQLCLIYAILLFILVVIIPLMLKMTLYGEPSFYSLFPIYSILFSCKTIFEVIKRLRQLQHEMNEDKALIEVYSA
ncbi:hypothetical protein EWB00_002472 [Schistosoma japonicum]|uniref:Transmembrane protein n=1 Tax=Schistosoma japonicum TaxID=6182 RepID=A0A4Z2DBL0_SCHJA|nr:hypothetical protein EWB00_002472 [Schistosoma japonicum]TNN13891.1 hypothetical protein EWB00_002472 [Schistosoma japonicum]